MEWKQEGDAYRLYATPEVPVAVAFLRPDGWAVRVEFHTEDDLIEDFRDGFKLLPEAQDWAEKLVLGDSE